MCVKVNGDSRYRAPQPTGGNAKTNSQFPLVRLHWPIRRPHWRQAREGVISLVELKGDMKAESWLILRPCLKVLPMMPTGSGFAKPPVKGAEPQLWGQADLGTVSSWAFEKLQPEFASTQLLWWEVGPAGKTGPTWEQLLKANDFRYFVILSLRISQVSI